MTKEQYSTNHPGESQSNASEDLLGNSLPPRTTPYRSLSAKRPRDPSHRKSVSFNDVPIVHEVPSHDAMRSSNCDTYRSWTYTDATSPTSVVPSFYSSQIYTPFNSSSAAAQKLHANRLSSALYSTPSTMTTTTATVTPNRIPDWALRTRPAKTTSNAEELNTSSDNTWNSPLIVVHAPDEKTNKDAATKSNNPSPYSSSHATLAQPHPPTSSSASNSEHGDEKKYPYRSAIVPDTDHYRSLPFNYGALSDSTATYTSMLSTNLIQSNHSSNEQPTTAHPRTARARSATLPTSSTYSSSRSNDTVSITPFRTATGALTPNGSSTSTRAVLRPTTIAFQCSQPTTASTNTTTMNNGSSAAVTVTHNTNTTNPSSITTTNSTKPPPVPPRLGSAAAAAAAHSRFTLPPHRALSTASLTSSALKYAFAHSPMDSTLNSTMPSHSTVPKPPPTAYPRSRSANVLSTRRAAAASPVVMLDGQSNGGTTTHSSANLYATTKRNPNVRQSYGSYYMHRVLLPTTIN